MSNFNIVFDIDHVLLSTDLWAADTDECNSSLKKLIEIFGNDIHHLSYKKILHVFAPGIIELIKWIFSLNDVSVSFFSSGDKFRNEHVVKYLLTQSLGEDKYSRIKDKIIILSADDLVKHSHYQNTIQNDKYTDHGGQYKKDLKKILNFRNKLGANDTLSRTILIDDTISYAFVNQETNLLCPARFDVREILNYQDLDKSSQLGRYIAQAHNEQSCFAGMNAIFYIANRLQILMELDRNDFMTITETVLKYSYVADGSKLKRNCADRRDRSIYANGLNLLRQFNPNMSLIECTSPKYYDGKLFPSINKIDSHIQQQLNAELLKSIKDDAKSDYEELIFLGASLY